MSEQTREYPCPTCGGGGQVEVSRHAVTLDMAIDAGDRSMAGMDYGPAFGPCDECGGTGLIDRCSSCSALRERAEVAEREWDIELARATEYRNRWQNNERALASLREQVAGIMETLTTAAKKAHSDAKLHPASSRARAILHAIADTQDDVVDALARLRGERTER